MRGLIINKEPQDLGYITFMCINWFKMQEPMYFISEMHHD